MPDWKNSFLEKRKLKKKSKKITAGNGKVSSWLRNVTREKEEDKIIFNNRRMEKEIIEDMEWITTPDPELKIARNVRKKKQPIKRRRKLTNIL